MSTMALSGGNYQTDAGSTASISLEECIQYVHCAAELADEIGWRPGEAFAMNVGGTVYAALGQYDRAFDQLLHCIAIANEIGHNQWRVAGLSGIGALYLDLLDPHQSRHHAESALVDARLMGSRLWVTTISAVLAAACLLDRDLDAAQTILDAVDLLEISQASQGGRSCWLVRAELCLARGDAAEALRIVDELIASDPHLSSQQGAPRLALLRGKALTSLGRLDDAEIALRVAVDDAVALGRAPLVWRAQVALGRVLRTRRRHADAGATFSAARETIDRLAATIPDANVRQRFLTNAAALLPRQRTLTPRQVAMQAHGGLTERECEVAVLIAKGMSNRAIAEQLYVSEPTVATHVSHVLSKLGVGSRTQVATWAVEMGLLSDT
jgi:DNA-binding CsgD family transcriptional regulator